jgi:RNA polymerase sigma factor (TIGR02999 family)
MTRARNRPSPSRNGICLRPGPLARHPTVPPALSLCQNFVFRSRDAPALLGAVNQDQVTPLLQRIDQGDPHAAGELLPLVYDELRRLAAAKLARESPGQTLQATALVHEAWLRLGGDQQPAWGNRAHFFAAAAEGMRRILIDNARRKLAVRHGGKLEKVSADATGMEIASEPADAAELLLVNEALDALAVHDPRKAELVKQRYFTGLTLEEAAQVLGISERTAKRDWAYARAWLYNEVSRLRQ